MAGFLKRGLKIMKYYWCYVYFVSVEHRWKYTFLTLDPNPQNSKSNLVFYVKQLLH